MNRRDLLKLTIGAVAAPLLGIALPTQPVVVRRYVTRYIPIYDPASGGGMLKVRVPLNFINPKCLEGW